MGIIALVSAHVASTESPVLKVRRHPLPLGEFRHGVLRGRKLQFDLFNLIEHTLAQIVVLWHLKFAENRKPMGNRPPDVKRHTVVGCLDGGIALGALP